MDRSCLVMTTARVKPGQAEAVVALFRETNPDLVAGEGDWLGAEVAVDREADLVVVTARWRRADSYRRFAASDRFRATMARFAPHLDGPPEVRVLERAFAMGTIGP